MNLTELEYRLSEELIAQIPVEPRDASRLMVVDRAGCAFSHRVFQELPDLLTPGDLLVANDSSVINARLTGRKPSGGRVELLLLRKRDGTRWEALAGGRNVKRVIFDAGVEATVESLGDGAAPRLVTFNTPIEPHLATLGETPLPPYIHARLDDASRYQTVYARVAGSAAAPTAGLHFTPKLIDTLRAKDIGFAFVTLHVGLDTFKPVEADDLADHKIHSEWCALPRETADAIARARARGGKVIAVGTTSARVLESARLFVGEGPLRAYSGFTNLFITPGFEFRVLDQLITNFHLPRSTLLALAGALAGMPCLRSAYELAMRERYRFFSFGDAMLIR
jgi:S-adenosylmethionine:tRNA ribosyltransferase-isomerase